MTVENILDGRLLQPNRLGTLDTNTTGNNTQTPNTNGRNPRIIPPGVAVLPLVNSQILFLHSLSMITNYPNLPQQQQQPQQRQNQPQQSTNTEGVSNER